MPRRHRLWMLFGLYLAYCQDAEGYSSGSLKSNPALCARDLDPFPQTRQRLAVAAYAVIEPLVVVPLGPKKPVEHPCPQAVVAGISRMVKRVIGRGGQKLADSPVVVLRLELEVGVTEGVYHQVADIPCAYSEEIQADQAIDAGQQSQQPGIEDELLGERERDRRERAVEMAPVMLHMDPMKRTQVERPVRRIVPDFRPDGGQQSGVYERHEGTVGEETK